MALAAGARLGPYEILLPLGAGGMGEVYRARDRKLDRLVAIKILPEAFAADADRLARFDREAKTLAALNHPNIAHIHGLEESDPLTGSGQAAVRALVMELVEGPTLADRIAHGPITIDEALPIAKQIAEALEAAHEAGIVHRDLKPANIKVRDDGTVKVLDFGLAKAMEPLSSSSAAAALANSPTMTSPAATLAGVILGTAAYMSPEQARGKPVDTRADIWAFGCVLFEMLTGTRAFNGEDVTDILASVLKHEPDWRDLSAATLAPMRELLRWCLEKDPRQRLQSIADARILLGRPAPEAPQRSRSWVAWSAAALLAVVAIAGWVRSGRGVTKPPSMTLTIVPPSGTQLIPVGNQGSPPEISPDASAVLYTAAGGLWVRQLDSLEPKLIPGSDAATGAAFWSADSTTVIYPARGLLVKVRLPDGAPQTITQHPGPTREGSWSDAGTILISVFDGLLAVPTSSGEAKKVEVSGLKPGLYLNPEFLPGGEDFVFALIPNDGREETEIYLLTLKDGKGVDPVLLLKNPTAARYTPAGGGRLLFVRNDNLYSQKLNRVARKLEGEAELVVQGVASQPGAGYVNRADFSVARNGAVAWRPGKAALSQVTIFDRQGNQVGATGPPGSITSLFLSPDETRILAAADRDWLLDVGQAGHQTLPTDADWFGWSRDGSKVLGSRARGDLVEFSANGSAEVRDLGPAAIRGIPRDVSPDGKQVLSVVAGCGGIFVTQLEGTEKERTSNAFVQSDEATCSPRFSPDGRWIVYDSGGLFVQPFPGPGRRQQATPRGRFPEWRKDGKEIVYVVEGGVMAVAVEPVGSQLRFGAPHNLFSGLRTPPGSNASARPLAVSRDGSRFYWPQAVEQPDSNVIHIKTGWVK